MSHFLTDPWAAHPVVNRHICHGGGGGGLFGGGIGAIAGDVLGGLLAPETGGLSLALPIALGAAGGFGGNALGDLVTGETFNPLQAGLAGLGGGLGGAFGAGTGLLDAVGGGAGGVGAAGAGAADVAGGITSDAGFAGAVGADIAPGGAGTVAGAVSPFGGAPLTEALGGGASLPSTFSPDVLGGAAPVTSQGASGPLDLVSFGNDVPAAGGATPAAGGPVFDPTGGAGPAALGGAIPGQPVGPLSASLGATPVGASSGPLAGIKDWLQTTLGLSPTQALSLGGLGTSLIRSLGGTTIPGQDQLSGDAALARQIASQNASGLNPPQTAAFSQQLAGQIAAIKAKYAQLGLSGSTAEQNDIQAAQNANLGEQASAITGNSNLALSAIGAANAPTLAIANQTLQDDNALSKAIAELAAAGLRG